MNKDEVVTTEGIYEPIEQRRILLHDLIRVHILKSLKGNSEQIESVLKDLDTVINQGYSIDPILLKSLTTVYTNIITNPKYKGIKGLSMVLRGSVLNSGQALRRALGTDKSIGTDIDIVLTTDPGIFTDREVSRELNTLIQDQLNKDLGPIKLEYNTAFDFYNFENVDQALKALEDVASTKKGFVKITPPTPTSLNACFLPSIPEEVGEKNLKLLLKALKILSKRNTETFSKVREMLFEDWDLHFPIKFTVSKFGLKKYKHLYFEGMDDEDSKRAEKIVILSNELQTMRYRSIWNSIY
ncbi:MAG: hypothetical protein ACMG57_00955 [Candidatus Dojkabacteria bacterium]